MKLYKRRPLLILGIALFGLSFIIRFQLAGYVHGDVLAFEKWYTYLYDHGWAGLANEKFSNYPPAYLYLVWLSTLSAGWLDAIFALKLIPTFFDLLSAYAIFKMARMRYENDAALLSAAVFFILPTIMVNSAGWGQIDSSYTSLLLVCIYFLLNEKPFWAMAAFGMAFAFKSQSIFLLPFLGIMFLKGKIRWSYFLLIPAVYVIFGIPMWLAGRGWVSILAIYIGQVMQFKALSFNAPNLYIFVPDKFYEAGTFIGIMAFSLIMATWGWASWRRSFPLTRRNIIFIAFASLAVVPFLLPKMHERYFYQADAAAYAAALFLPETWWLVILYQISSGLSYSVYFFNAPVVMVMIGAVINTFSTVFIFKKIVEMFLENKPQDMPESTSETVK